MNRGFVAAVCTVLALCRCGLAGQTTALDWNSAVLKGETSDGRMFYLPGEEMTFSIWLEGLKGTLPADTYFVDWERRGDDGLSERGRAALPFPDGKLTVRTKADRPGFVCIEANVVTADGKRVPKEHRWEKRVFFQGGAGVEPDKIPLATEPPDYDSFWNSCLAELDRVPLTAEMKELPCDDKLVRLYAVRIACAGPCPVTGYLTVPTAACATNRLPVTAGYRGASKEEQLPPKAGPHDRISMLINPNGYELGRGAEYVKQFFKDVSEPGYGYGMGPKSNEKKETSYWKWCALRAIRYVQWIKTLPEWNGKDLVLRGGSQGDWQAYHAAAHVPGVSCIEANGSWGGDWTGQAQFGRQRSTYRPKDWFPDMAYFDPVFAAARISCPVNISFAGLGDYCSTPASLTLIFRNLKGPRKITYQQGSTHGWRPEGSARQEVDRGWNAWWTASHDPVTFVREAVSRGAKTIVVPKATYEIDTKGPAYFDLKGLRDVVIDFQGGRLNGVRRTRMFNLSDSTNVVIRNVTVDYVRLPFAQGVIEKVDAETNWVVRILAGYPCPDDGELSRLTWPVQVYDAKTLELKNPMRYPDAKVVRTGSDTYRVTGGKDRRGDVGDYCVWSIRDADGQRDALNLSACAGCRVENVTVYSTPMGCGFNEADCASNVYLNCRLVRCPESEDTVRRAFRRLRSGNHDALNARRDYVGPTLDGCDFEYHCDDCVNISGFYSVVSRVAGNRIRILPYGGALRIDVGDSCQILTADWKYPPDVRVVAIEPGGETTDEERKQVAKWNFTHGIGNSLKRAWWLTLDRPAGFDAGSCIVSNRRTGNGFKIVNSHFGSTRSRGLLIKASDGLIASNVIEKTTGRAISVTPEFRWLEGGCSTNLVVRDNVIRQESGIRLYDKRALRNP